MIIFSSIKVGLALWLIISIVHDATNYQEKIPRKVRILRSGDVYILQGKYLFTRWYSLPSCIRTKNKVSIFIENPYYNIEDADRKAKEIFHSKVRKVVKIYK